MPTQDLQPCARCGILGIHACLGVKQQKMSKREKTEFERAISAVVKSIKAQRQGGAE